MNTNEIDPDDGHYFKCFEYLFIWLKPLFSWHLVEA